MKRYLSTSFLFFFFFWRCFFFFFSFEVIAASAASFFRFFFFLYVRFLLLAHTPPPHCVWWSPIVSHLIFVQFFVCWIFSKFLCVFTLRRSRSIWVKGNEFFFYSYFDKRSYKMCRAVRRSTLWKLRKKETHIQARHTYSLIHSKHTHSEWEPCTHTHIHSHNRTLCMDAHTRLLTLRFQALLLFDLLRDRTPDHSPKLLIISRINNII